MSIGKKPAANIQPFPFDIPEAEPPGEAASDAESERAEKRAWRVLVVAFAVFLLSCGVTVYAVQWYVFQSTVDMGIAVVPARGIVQMGTDSTQANIAISARDSIEPGAILRTDSSQAVVTFTDPATGDKAATLTVLADSSVRIVSASAPRFGLNADGYVVELATDSARLDIRGLTDARRDVRIVLRTPHAVGEIAEGGFYRAEVTDRHTRLSVVEGSALVANDQRREGVAIESGEVAITEAESFPYVVRRPEQELLANHSLATPLNRTWSFYDDSEQPPGQPALFRFDGLDVASLDRSQENWPGVELGHGETGLRQYVGIDVRGHSSLELSSTFYIAEQSLSVCGQEGSECPMMLRMTYVDEAGFQREYIQGFYAYNDLAGDKPLTCQTCRSEHERIAMETWYTYRSGNLFASLPPEQRPAIIQQMRFYASGHAYHTYVAEVSLTVVP